MAFASFDTRVWEDAKFYPCVPVVADVYLCTPLLGWGLSSLVLFSFFCLSTWRRLAKEQGDWLWSVLASGASWDTN